jgi:type IV pilus assembly protein PilO
MKQLPGKMEVSNLLTDITQSGQAQGLDFQVFQPSPEKLREFFAEQPVSVTVVGSFHDMGRFFEAIAKMPRIIALSGLTITPASGKDAGKLKMSMEIKVFRYLTEEEAQQQRKGGKKK